MAAVSIDFWPRPLARRLAQEVAHEVADVLEALAQRRNAQRHDVEAVEEVLAEQALLDLRSCRSRWVAAMMRTLVLIGVRPPTVVYSPSCSTRSSRVCASSGMSPISSRNSVPPSACSKRPCGARLRAGEGALLVAEQLALDQLARDGRHVDGDERAAAAAWP